MDVYKTFLFEVQKLSFVEPFLKINGDSTPLLRNYVKLLVDVKYEDGSYYKYYGDVKNIVNSFIACYGKTIDEIYKVADKYMHVVNRNELLELIETTIDLNQTKQIDFGRDFLPVKSKLEEEMYKEVEDYFENYMGRLHQLRSDIERLDKQDKIEKFAQDQFPLALHKENELFSFAHSYISSFLATPITLDKLRVSLEEILLRTQNNVKCLQDKRTNSLNSLLNQLYDKNKEKLFIYRQETRSSLEIAEVQRSMEILKDKIEDSKHMPISRLMEEYEYWQDRLEEFKQILKAVVEINLEKMKITEQEKIFHRIQCPIKPGPKGECWNETEQTIQDNVQAIGEMQTDAARALMSFLSVRGPNHSIYTDNVGPFYVDEYGHQVYFFDFGLKMLHVNCEGQFVEPHESEKYYYDKMGRFIIDDDGTKLYKMGTCTSTHRLTNDVFEKQTADCGHSQRQVAGCKMTIKDPNDVTFLPLTENVDLNEILEPETSQYLWRSFGHILPLVLRDLAMAQPRNPTHYLAHKLLFHKFSRSKGELATMKVEAEKYRAKVFQDRKDAAVAASKAWRARQVKRRKPEESDDAAEWFAYNAYTAQQQAVRDLNFFYD